MAQELDRIEIAYTYTYDQFTVFFYGDRVFVGKKDYPIGQCCVDVMNLDETVLDEINLQVKAFVPAVRKLLTEKRQRRSSRTRETERYFGMRPVTCCPTAPCMTALSGS